MRTRIGWIVAFVVVAVTPSARASQGPIDTLAMLSSLSAPALAIDPTTGNRHTAYLSAGILVHGWESPGGWQTEAIVDSASITSYSTFRLRIASDGHAVAAYVRNGRLVCAIGGGGGWQRDTLDVLPGPFYPVDLALDPVSGEAAVAWARQSASPSSPSQIFYARHGGLGWTTLQVDTVSSAWLTVALGVDRGHRPHMAWGRPRAEGTGTTVLTYGVGVGPDGPFTPAPVDSQLSLFLALDVDRSNGEPRLAYDAINGGDREIRYAFRGIGDAWQWMRVSYVPGTFPYSPPSLALDPAGNPFIGYTYVVPIEPGLAQPDGAEACGSVNSWDVLAYYRAGGAGFGPFSLEWLTVNEGFSGGGMSAVASGTTGEAFVAWRSPPTNICPPIALSSCRVIIPSLTGVGGHDPPILALAPVWPNPARAGDDLHVEFGLARDAVVSLELLDLVGRRAAARSPAPMPAGRRSVAWSIPGLSPGLYWLTVRSDGARIGSRSLVILR